MVTAVGTAFNVRLQDDQLNVLVTEGTVRVGADISSGIEIAEGEARVTAGEAASLHEGAITHQVVKPAQIEAGLAWRQGMLIFNEEPLEQVLEEFSRYAPVEFVFADDKLRRIPVVGYFRIGDIDSLSIALENNFQILADRSQENRIVLSAAP